MERIPLYINSRDRDSPLNKTTDFTIQLRKSIYNIGTISIGNIVIPNSETHINTNNNVLEGTLTITPDSYPFQVVLTKKNYTNEELATELTNKLNSNSTFAVNGVTWSVVYDVDYIVTLTLVNGHLYDSWGVTLEHTRLVDVIGIGNSEATAKTYTVTGSVLNVICERGINLSRGLYYNITSKKLTDSINTSYIKSLGKQFDINSTNNTFSYNIKQEIKTPQKYDIPVFENQEIKKQFGAILGLSDHGLTMMACNELETFIFTRATTYDQWVQTNSIYTSAITAAALSSNGDNIVVLKSGEGVTSSVVWVYMRAGYNWNLQSTITLDGKYGSTISITDNDTYNISDYETISSTFAVGDPLYNSGAGNVVVYIRKSNQWTKQATLGSADISSQGYAIRLRGNTLAVGSPGDSSFWVYTRSGTWDSGVKHTVAGTSSLGKSISISADGTLLAVGAPEYQNNGAVYVFNLTNGSWVQYPDKLQANDFTQGMMASTDMGRTVDVSSNAIIFGSPGENNGSGATWLFQYANGAWSQTGNMITAGFTGGSENALAMSNDSFIVGCPGHNTELGGINTFPYGNNPVGVLMANQTAGGAQQGGVMDMSSDGKTVMFGGELDSKGKGTVWVYTRSGTQWTQSRITSSVDNAAFGSSISIVASKYAIGAKGSNSVWIGLSDSNTFEPTVSFSHSSLTSFGSKVLLSEDGMFLLVLGYAANTFGSVVVYSFTNNNWVEHTTLVSSTTTFGQSVALSPDGKYCAIGSEGSVHIYVDWVLTQTLTNANTAFGASVSLSNTLLLVGQNDTPGTIHVYQLSDYSTSTISHITISGDNVSQFGNSVYIDPSATFASVIYRTGCIVDGYPSCVFGTNNAVTDLIKTSVVINQAPNIIAVGNFTVLGMASDRNGSGSSDFIISAGDVEDSYTLTIPVKYYSLQALSNYIGTSMNNTSKYTITMEPTSENSIQLSVVGAVNVVTVKPTTGTLEVVTWGTNASYALSHTSTDANMSINNGVVKSVSMAPDLDEKYIRDNAEDSVFRKYRAGYTIDAASPIDVQLRDERDRVVDLKGLDWSFTVYLTIHS